MPHASSPPAAPQPAGQRPITPELLDQLRRELGIRFHDVLPQAALGQRPETVVSEANYRRQAQEYRRAFDTAIKGRLRINVGEGRRVGFLWFCTGTPKEIRSSIFLGDLFREMGFDPVWIACDGAPVHCFSNRYVAPSAAGCAACALKMRQVLDIFGQHRVPLECVAPAAAPEIDAMGLEEALAWTYKGFAAGRAAFYSSLKFTQNDYAPGPEELLTIRAAMRAYANTYEAVAATLERSGIDVLFTEGGQYVNNRAAVNAAADLGRDYLCYENWGPQRIILAKDTSCFNQPVDQFPFSMDEEQAEAEGARYVEDIRSGKLYSKTFNDENASARAPFDDYVLLIPNVSWDSAVWYFDSAFYRDQYEWLLDTMRRCTERGLKFVVRCHPGEKRMASRVYLRDILRSGVERIFGGAFENGVQGMIYGHDDDVSTYDLLEGARSAVVYVSTMGLELPHYGVPTVVVGRPYYRGHGFGLHPASRGEYYDLLEAAPAVDEAEKRNLHVYLAKLRNRLVRYNYGEFYKYVGSDEAARYGLDRARTYGVFPFQDMDLDKVVRFMVHNFRRAAAGKDAAQGRDGPGARTALRPGRNDSRTPGDSKEGNSWT
ncbi:MAG: hypothetical protein H0S85_01155 [Desulfovibrionaceae bacterium]|jgi:hypothetical protein|nr:hypothetical protein [Desulfovibrionaceae bacterium]